MPGMQRCRPWTRVNYAVRRFQAAEPVEQAPGHHGTGNQTVAEYSRSRLGEPGRGLESGTGGCCVYTDLKSLAPYPDQREPEREIELHLTGHMTGICGRSTVKNIQKPASRFTFVTANVYA